MKTWARHGAACAISLLMAWPVWAQGPEAERVRAAEQAQRDAERDKARSRIQHERDQLELRRRVEEAACYKRFAVEDCLTDVRRSQRDAHSRLQREEIEINDAERRERTAERLRTIEERQRSASEAASTAVTRTPAPRITAIEREQRDSQARERAQRQREQVQERATQNAERAATAPTREAEARERYEAKQKAAQERREKLLRTQAEETAAGHKPAASLPSPVQAPNP